MSIDWEVVAKVAAAIAPVVVGLLGLVRGPAGGLRGAIRHEAETLKNLPSGGPAADALEARLVRQIEALDKATSPDARREWPMLVLSLVCAPLLGWFTIYGLQREGWLWTTAAFASGFLGLIFLYGIFESAQRVPRDSKGRAQPNRKVE